MSLISRRTVLATAAAMPVAAWATPVPGSYGQVRRHSAGLDAIVAVDTPVEQLGWGYTWVEGPVWVKDGGFLLFSDPRANTIYRWAAGSPVQIYMKPSGYDGEANPALREPGSNGLAIDATGALVMCDSGSRGLARVDLKTKKKSVIIDKFDGKKFNSPNDLCIAKSGAIYFTDPPYGLADGLASAVKELPFSGVYRLAPDGTIAVIDKTMNYPNGIALSPDESMLYATNSDASQPILKAYRLGPDGLPQVSDKIFDFSPITTADAKGAPDGIKVDQDGNLFVAGPGGILVLSKEGKLLGVINVTGRATPNFAFGEDGSSLFITASDILARIRLKTKAAGWA